MGVGTLHPVVAAVFFAVVIATTVAWSHPVFLGISFAFAFAYSVKLGGPRAGMAGAVLAVLACAFAALFAANVHFGVTVLGQTSIGNQVTLESLLYGLALGFKVAAALMWLGCLVRVFTADKVVYLLGRASPRLALFAAVGLRGAPLIASQMKRISTAQRGIGRGAGQGSAAWRARNWVRRVSALVTWAIERLAQMSDSMRSRGSSLRGRTSFALFRFGSRDRALALVLGALSAAVLFGSLLDQARMLYSPELLMNPVTPASYAFFAAYALLCAFPLAYQLAVEAVFARASQSVSPGESDLSVSAKSSSARENDLPGASTTRFSTCGGWGEEPALEVRP